MTVQLLDFKFSAVQFNGKAGGYSYNTKPTIYSTGNQLYNCTITDCSNSAYEVDGAIQWDFITKHGGGNVLVTGQKGLLIHDNTLRQTGAPAGMNNNILDAKEGYNQGLKFYNNISYKPEGNGNDWNFHIESWNVTGGFEVYNNKFYGGTQPIDVGGNTNTKGSYAYSWWIHNNLFSISQLQPKQEPNIIGITLESLVEDVIIEKNHFENFPFGVTFGITFNATDHQERIRVNNNLFENVGWKDDGDVYKKWSYAIFLETTQSTSYFKDIYIYNNTIKAAEANPPYAGICFNSIKGPTTNIRIVNNIIMNFYSAPILITQGSPLGNIDYLYDENNIMYGSPAHDNDIFYQGGEYITHLTQVNNIKQDPILVGGTPFDFSLKTGSPAINAGKDVGLTTDFLDRPISGMPDIGAIEYQSATTQTLNYVSSAIADGTPDRLDIIFDQTLANKVPPVSSFTVRVNSGVRTVNSVSISGSSVLLKLYSPVVQGDVVTVAYNKSSTNPIQSISGIQATSISARNVTNNIKAVDPQYVSSSVENATPSILQMNYDLTLANVVPAASAFIVRVNSIVRNVLGVNVSGSSVLLAMSSPVFFGDAIIVAYTKTATNPLQTSLGGQVASFSARSVTNNVKAANPQYVNSSVENATPLVLQMYYDMALAKIAPPTTAFSVKVNSTIRSVRQVSISGQQVLLTLSSPVFNGDTIMVSYLKPTNNPLQGVLSGLADNINNKPVTNKCINVPPSVEIISPLDKASFKANSNITFMANAMDPDGSVALIEFYAGNNKIGAMTQAPFTLALNNLSAGNYQIKAVATDNRNAQSTSSPVSITVYNGKSEDNLPPVVEIVSRRRKSDKFELHSSVTLDAIASDPDGEVTKIEFYRDSIKLYEDDSPPFNYTLNNLETGKYSITAVATDNSNGSAVSAPYIFEVAFTANKNIVTDNIKLYPNPNEGHFSIELNSPVQNTRSEIMITDMTGKEIYRGSMEQGLTKKNIDLAKRKSGIYVLFIKCGESLLTKKIIID